MFENASYEYDGYEYSLDCHFLSTLCFHNLITLSDPILFLVKLQYSIGMSTCWPDNGVDSRSSLNGSSSFNRTSKDITWISARLTSIFFYFNLFWFSFFCQHTLGLSAVKFFLSCIINKTLLLQSVSCLHRWATFPPCFPYKQQTTPLHPPPLAVSITDLWWIQGHGKMLTKAWILDMIDSYLIEKLRIRSSMSHLYK